MRLQVSRMERKEPRAYWGLVDRRSNSFDPTASLFDIPAMHAYIRNLSEDSKQYKHAHEGLPPIKGGKYLVVCERHLDSVRYSRLGDAMAALGTQQEWCVGCMPQLGEAQWKERRSSSC